MSFVTQNLPVVLTGAGAVALAFIAAYFKYSFDKKLKNQEKAKASSAPTGQTIKSGSNSTNTQAGRDINVGR